MVYFDISLGLKELYTLKNFSFDIINSGSGDLLVNDISISSDNVKLSYIKTPFTIMIDTTYSLFGYLKILNAGNSHRNDYIDFNISYLIGDNTEVLDVYRYYLNYESIFDNKFTQIFTVNNINYINNFLCIYLEVDTSIASTPNIILSSIDNINYNIFPKIYKLSSTIIVYIYDDNVLKNKVINDNLSFTILNNVNSIDIKNISYRSI